MMASDGLSMNDIGKVLVRPDSDVDEARLYLAAEFRDDVKVRGLVRDEIMGIKIAFRLR